MTTLPYLPKDLAKESARPIAVLKQFTILSRKICFPNDTKPKLSGVKFRCKESDFFIVDLADRLLNTTYFPNKQTLKKIHFVE